MKKQGTRYAWVSRRNIDNVDNLDRYLPDNYQIVGELYRYRNNGAGVQLDVGGSFLIEGEDFAGWTLDDYVIPRLASGLITCVEIPAEVGRQITEGTP